LFFYGKGIFLQLNNYKNELTFFSNLCKTPGLDNLCKTKSFVMGKLADIKTKETSASVDDFINGITGEQQRKDSFAILKIMEKATKQKPKMWGGSLIGFGNLIYKSPKTGREVEWFKIGFSPRKTNLSIYLMDLKRHADALKKLGKHKTGAGCLYINNLVDVDIKILEKMITVAAK
jgi:hypothetical protein